MHEKAKMEFYLGYSYWLLAAEGLPALSMAALVHLQVAGRHVGLAAVAALVWALTGVGPHVHLEISVAAAFLAACCALVRFFTCGQKIVAAIRASAANVCQTQGEILIHHVGGIYHIIHPKHA